MSITVVLTGGNTYEVEEPAVTERLALGTRVCYHGSIRYLHGTYTLNAYSDLSLRTDLLAGYIAEHWPDGTAYDLWPEGVPVKFGNRDRAVYFVRRDSFTVLGDSEETGKEQS